MPWLESVTNSIKASALSNKAVRTQNAFNGYDWSKKVAVMRSTAAVMSYMTEPAIVKSLKQQSECIKEAWLEWFLLYLQIPGIPPTAKTVNLEALYLDWFQFTIMRMKDDLLTSMANMITWWNIQAKGAGVVELVQVDFNNRIKQGPIKSVKGSDLTYLWNYINNTNWN
ncbi:hypothetical protein FRC17_003980 [Serendipita sp. 399]|nr:hypothetical protein FRC17_003980 [Serendipita sp. 399]